MESTPGDPLLSMVLNLSQYHREHEKFYSESPLHDAITLQRDSRALKALAERWTVATPEGHPSPSPFAGAPDLNDDRATETAGILFMEGEGEPAEITRMKSDLSALADGLRSAGEWLTNAMQAAWGVAEALLNYPDLADLLAERHRIISNDWQAASMATLAAENIDRALSVLGRIDFTPASLAPISPRTAYRRATSSPPASCSTMPPTSSPRAQPSRTRTSAAGASSTSA